MSRFLKWLITLTPTALVLMLGFLVPGPSAGDSTNGAYPCPCTPLDWTCTCEDFLTDSTDTMSTVKIKALRTFKGQPGEGLVRPRQVIEVEPARARQLVGLGFASMLNEASASSDEDNSSEAHAEKEESGKDDSRPKERESKTDGPSETKSSETKAAADENDACEDEAEHAQEISALMQEHTKKALYEMAQDLDIDGRSKMDERQLAEAIIEARAES